MLPPAIFAPAQFRAANAVTFVVNGALGGFAFVFIPALEIIAGYSPVVAGSALVPVTVVTLLLSGASGRLAAADRPPAATGGGLPAVHGCVHARRAHRPPRRLLDGRIAGGRAVRPWPGRPPATPDRQRDELRPRLPGRPGLRGEQRRGAGRGPALDRRAAAPHRPHRCAPTPTRRSSGPASPRSAGSARQRSPAPRCSPQPSSPGLAAAPRRDGRRSFKLRCPTSPARSPSATHRDKPADRTAARQATAPVSPILLHLAAPG